MRDLWAKRAFSWGLALSAASVLLVGGALLASLFSLETSQLLATLTWPFGICALATLAASIALGFCREDLAESRKKRI